MTFGHGLPFMYRYMGWKTSLSYFPDHTSQDWRIQWWLCMKRQWARTKEKDSPNWLQPHVLWQWELLKRQLRTTSTHSQLQAHILCWQISPERTKKKKKKKGNKLCPSEALNIGKDEGWTKNVCWILQLDSHHTSDWEWNGERHPTNTIHLGNSPWVISRCIKHAGQRATDTYLRVHHMGMTENMSTWA